MGAKESPTLRGEPRGDITSYFPAVQAERNTGWAHVAVRLSRNFCIGGEMRSYLCVFGELVVA